MRSMRKIDLEWLHKNVNEVIDHTLEEKGSWVPSS